MSSGYCFLVHDELAVATSFREHNYLTIFLNKTKKGRFSERKNSLKTALKWSFASPIPEGGSKTAFGIFLFLL